MTLASLKALKSTLASVACLVLTLSASAQTPLPQRFTTPIENASRVTLPHSRSPLASPSADLGAVDSSMKLQGISLVFNRTPTQQAALAALIAAQQNPASPLYHQWLTPDQFAARFGVADADIAAVESWLQFQGFAIDSVSRSRDRIVFSGTAGLVASAFGAPLHYFKSTPTLANPSGTRVAPSTDLTLPAALAANVQGITNLSTFRPHSHLRQGGTPGARPAFTSSASGSRFITPGDINTIYDVTPAYSAGFDGSGQSITVVGQSAILLSDVAAFQSATGVIAKTPQMVIVPSSGSAQIYSGDESESDLDVEYSSTIGKGAQVFFVYTGNNPNYGVFDALSFAVDQRISPIITVSYGECEPLLGQSNYDMLDAILQQGASQGQTILVASGDDGSTDCYGEYSSTDVADNEVVAVDFPASSQYVTAMGGTEFPAADVAAGTNTYFAAQGATDIVSSALSYVPEMVWDDDAAFAAAGASSPLASGGGGVSIFTPRPTWQTGTIGGVAIPAGTFRLLPDISLDASPVNAPLAYCSSDTSGWNTAANGGTPPYQVGSCTSGFRDASSGDLTIAGGTSFVAPIFAGMVSLINQSLNSTGQGVINPTLYTLATSSATYGSAFHDITSGSNKCLAGAAYCSTAGTDVYAAATGYDEASGLGSIDLYKLLTAWPQPATAALAATTTTLTAATNSPAAGATDVITITVASATTAPTGTVALMIDGAAATSATTLTLVNGTATYTFSSAAETAHVIVANYSGDATFAPSTGTLVLTIPVPTVGSFSMTATSVTVAAGSSGTSTATITPAGGYTGTVDFGFSGPANLTNACITGEPTASITGTAPVATVFTFYTSATVCASLGNAARSPQKLFKRFGPTQTSSISPTRSPWRNLPVPAALAGTLLLFGLGRQRSRTTGRNLLRAGLSLAVLVTLSLAGLSLTACSSSATATAPVNNPLYTPAGTYALTITATDGTTGQTASADFNLIVQ